MRFYSITELGECITSGGVGTDTATAGVRDTALTRCAMTTSDPAAYLESPEFLDAAFALDFYEHSEFVLSAGANNSTVWWIGYNSGGTAVFRITNNGTFNTMQAQYWNGASWINTGGTFLVASGGTPPHKLDIHIIAATSFEIFIDKDMVTSGALGATVTNIAKTRRFCPRSSAGVVYWSQVAAADYDLRDLSIKTMPPVGAGTYTDGAGTWAAVDEIGLDDADMIALTNVGDTHTVVPADYTVPTGREIDSFWVVGRGRTDVDDLRWVLRSGSTDDESTDLNVTTGFTTKARCWDTDPADGNPITNADLNGFEYGLKAVA